MARGMAQLSDATVGVERIAGRDEFGLDIVEKLPTKYSQLYMDRSGNEAMHPMVNGRTVEPESVEKYRPLIQRALLQSGFIPVQTCPHASHPQFGDRPLVSPPAGYKSCKGGRKVNAEDADNDSAVRLAEYNPHLKSARLSERLYVRPCKHYLEHRERLQARARAQSEQRKKALLSTPAGQVRAMAESLVKLAGGIGADAGNPLTQAREAATAKAAAPEGGGE